MLYEEKKINLPCIIFILLQCITTENLAQKINPSIQIDGNEKEWRENTFKIDSSSGFEYSFLKNQDTLFFIVRFINKTTQIKSLATGMQIGFDMYQKNKPQQFINFPLDHSSKIDLGQSMRDPISMQYSLLPLSIEYELKNS